MSRLVRQQNEGIFDKDKIFLHCKSNLFSITMTIIKPEKWLQNWRDCYGTN